VGGGIAQSLMTIIKDRDLKSRGLESQGGYNAIMGVGDADTAVNLAFKNPATTKGMQLARGALGLGARGVGVFGAGMSAVALKQALSEGDMNAATSSATKTAVLGGSVLRPLAKPIANAVLSESAKVAARRAGASGLAKVVGTATGPIGMAALTIGDVAVQSAEWRAAAYYGSMQKIYSEAQVESLGLGPDYRQVLLTPAGIAGSLKSIQTNVEGDGKFIEQRFKSEVNSLAESLAKREVLGLSIEPMSGDSASALAKHFAGSAPFNPLASNVPPFIKELCKKKQLKCTRTETRYNVGMGGFGGIGGGNPSSFEVPVEDYSVAMADYVLKEKAKEKAVFEKQWKDALSSGKADADWLAFHQAKEKLEAEYTPRLKQEAEELAKKAAPQKDGESAVQDEQTPLQKEYAAKLMDAYQRTIYSSQLSESMLEFSGVSRELKPEERKSFRETVKSQFENGKPKPNAAKALQGSLLKMELTGLSRKTGLPEAKVSEDLIGARFQARKSDFSEGMKAAGIDPQQLPEGVKQAVDEVLRQKLELEGPEGPLGSRSAETQEAMLQSDQQLEALLYGIQRGHAEKTLTEAKITEYAQVFLGGVSGERKAASLVQGASDELNKTLTPAAGDARVYEKGAKARLAAPGADTAGAKSGEKSTSAATSAH